MVTLSNAATAQHTTRILSAGKATKVGAFATGSWCMCLFWRTHEQAFLGGCLKASLTKC